MSSARPHRPWVLGVDPSGFLRIADTVYAPRKTAENLLVFRRELENHGLRLVMTSIEGVRVAEELEEPAGLLPLTPEFSIDDFLPEPASREQLSHARPAAVWMLYNRRSRHLMSADLPFVLTTEFPWAVRRDIALADPSLSRADRLRIRWGEFRRELRAP